ncbi:hypothetical protein [Parabacteroides goldsteinii]
MPQIIPTPTSDSILIHYDNLIIPIIKEIGLKNFKINKYTD